MDTDPHYNNFWNILMENPSFGRVYLGNTRSNHAEVGTVTDVVGNYIAISLVKGRMRYSKWTNEFSHPFSTLKRIGFEKDFSLSQ